MSSYAGAQIVGIDANCNGDRDGDAQRISELKPDKDRGQRNYSHDDRDYWRCTIAIKAQIERIGD